MPLHNPSILHISRTKTLLKWAQQSFSTAGPIERIQPLLGALFGAVQSGFEAKLDAVGSTRQTGTLHAKARAATE
jgi:hypothetical protein